VFKDVVVNLSGRAAQDFAADYAVSVAAAFGAHLTGVAFLYDPIIPDGGFGAIPVDVIELQREENAKVAGAAIERFEAAAKRAGVAATSRTVDATLGGGATLFGRMARRFDLAVIGQAQREHGASEELMVEGALFESGRPLLVVPYIQRDGFAPGRVLVAWDGSATAARAVADAMPFLARATAVDLLIVTEERKHVGVAGVRMSAHLARHGVSAAIRRVERGDLAIGDAILSYAADSDAGMLVMGGYGHSRLREFVLGGVTRGILHSMTLPVLMSH
jgi:nucleotide-binding universal stress UspA family protein